MRLAALFMTFVAVGCGGDDSNKSNVGKSDGAMKPDADAAAPMEDLAMLDSASSDANDASLDDAKATVTTLRVHYPANGHSITVRGDTSPLSWTSGTSMTNLGGNVWQAQVHMPASSATIDWKPLLDDSTWARGPNYVVARGATVDIYPHFTTVTGTVYQIWPTFFSNNLQNSRTVWAYLPPSYYENTEATYPVLYMHDGQNLFSTQPTFGTNGWQVDATLNAAAEDGSIREIIVIAPEAEPGNQRYYEYTPTYDPSEMLGGGGDLYMKFLIDEIKPQVDQMLRTQSGAATTGIMGSSLGGLISSYAGYTHADTYGIVGAMSPSTWWDNEIIVADVKKTGSTRPDLVYVDCGSDGTSDDEDGLTETKLLFTAYTGIGYVEGKTFKHVIQEGGQHSEKYWAERLPVALQFLFGPRTN